MITPNELRIGNWVLLQANTSSGNIVEHAKVIELGEDFIRTSILNVSQLPTSQNIYGIELTSEILYRCNSGFWNLFSDAAATEDGIKFYEYKIDDLQIKTLQPLKYLHEFQNAYFVITGKELRISL